MMEKICAHCMNSTIKCCIKWIYWIEQKAIRLHLRWRAPAPGDTLMDYDDDGDDGSGGGDVIAKWCLAFGLQ